MKKNEHYRYTHLSLICQEYERAAIGSGSREGAVAGMWRTVKNVRTVLDSSESSLDTFNGFGALLRQSNEEDLGGSRSRGGSSEETAAEHPTTGCGPQEEPEEKNIDINLFDPSRESKLSVEPREMELKGPGTEVRLQNAFDALGLEVITAEELLNYFDECWDCDLKIQFDWQIKPLNLLLGLESFIQDIEDIIDQILNALDPTRMIKDICDFFDGFSWICPPDLVMLLLALAMLIKKYISLALNLTLDWTALLAPLIKWIVDALASLLQQIIQIVMAPLDCMIGVLQSIQSVIDATDQLGDAALAAAAFFSAPFRNEATFMSESSPTPEVIGQVTDKNIFGYNKEGGWKLARETTETAARNSTKEKFSVPTGINIGVEDTFDSFLAQRRKDKQEGKATFDLSQISVFKVSILAVQTAKSFILDMYNQLMYALSSLNGVFNGRLAINIESLGLVLLLIDLVKIIKIVIALSKAGLKSCDDIAKHPHALAAALEQQFPNMDFAVDSDNNVIKVNDGLYKSEVPLPECDTQGNRTRSQSSQRTMDFLSKQMGVKIQRGSP